MIPFSELKVGERFRTIGKVTGKLSPYLYTKIEPIRALGGIDVNAKATVGKKNIVKYACLWPKDPVEKEGD